MLVKGMHIGPWYEGIHRPLTKSASSILYASHKALIYTTVAVLHSSTVVEVVFAIQKVY